MGVMVGRWDCKYCGHKGNLGPDTQCRSCAAPRDPDVKFYLPEDAEYTTDEELLKRADAGADWTCAFCGSDMSALKEQCDSCGHTREASDKLRGQKEYGLDEVPHSDEDTRGIKPPSDEADAGKKRKTSAKPLLGCLGILVAIVAILVFIFYPRSTTVKVAGHEWTRSIVIENYREVEEQGWNIPSGGKKVREFQAEHHKEKILDHYETRTRSKQVKVGTEKYVCGKVDMGNGLFKDKYCTRDKYETRTEKYQEPVYRYEPVYQTKYAYKIYRWVTHATNRANGSDADPHWPEGAPEGDKWRDGPKEENYLLIVKDKKGRSHEFELPLQVWQKYGVGDNIPATMNMAGQVELEL